MKKKKQYIINKGLPTWVKVLDNILMLVIFTALIGGFILEAYKY